MSNMFDGPGALHGPLVVLGLIIGGAVALSVVLKIIMLILIVVGL